MATLDSKFDIARAILLIFAIIVVILAVIDRIQIRRKLRMITVDTPTDLKIHHHVTKEGKLDYFILTWKACKGAAAYRIFESPKRDTKIIDCHVMASHTNQIKLPYPFPSSSGPYYYKIGAINEHRIVSHPSVEVTLENPLQYRETQDFLRRRN